MNIFDAKLTKEEYISFFNTVADAHFLQSYASGAAKEKSAEGTPYFVGLKNEEGKIVCATLLFKINVPLKQYYFYAPRGYLIDYNNKDLLKEFTNHLKEFVKKEKALYLKVNPNIVFHTLDDNGNRLEENICNNLFDYFISLGYIHLGFNKLFEQKLHRFTFRIDLTQGFSEIEKQMKSGFIKGVKKSNFYDLEIEINDNVSDFYELLDNNVNKIGFHKLSLNHYQNIYEEFNKEKNVKLFNVNIDSMHLEQKLLNEQKTLKEELLKNSKNNESIKEKLIKIEKDLEFIKTIPKEKHTICSLMAVYANKHAWLLYIANNQAGVMFNAQNRAYYEAIKDAKDNNYEYIDLYGTVGNPNTKISNYGSLCQYKKKMGGKYIEFIGEFDLINNKFLYKFLRILNKIYHKIK